jgi:hypothetical protein
MRFMMMVKHSENQGPPPKGFMDVMAKLGEDAVKAGTMVLSGGLASTAASTRVRLSEGQISAIDGPFTEAKEVVGGFAILLELLVGKELDQLREYGAPRIHPALSPLRRSPPRMLSTPFEFQIVLTPKPMHRTESTTLVLSLKTFPRTGVPTDMFYPLTATGLLALLTLPILSSRATIPKTAKAPCRVTQVADFSSRFIVLAKSSARQADGFNHRRGICTNTFNAPSVLQ